MEFARAQLLKYGWKEGKGLGRHETGITEALKPKLKFDTTGVGHDGSEQFTYNWWEHAFNKAAKNVKIQSTEKGVVVQADEELDISTKKYSVLAMKKKKNLEYGTFLKTSTLTNEGRTVDIAKEEGDEEEAEATNVENARDITDEELFRICGGRTAHKGARHGLKLNGKLARIEAQEKQLIKSVKPSQTEEICSSMDKTAKKKKKTKLEMCTDDDNVHLHQVHKKKKKKKRKTDESDCEQNPEETAQAEAVVPTKKKKKKRKNCDSETQENKDTEDICVENVTTYCSSLKKHKKSKKHKDTEKV